MKKKISIGYQDVRSHLRYLLPVMVWLGAVICVAVLFYHRSQRFEVLGLAQGQVHQVAATCMGRLKSVPVELFDEVKQGQTVAVLDTVLDNEHIEAELATVTAEIEHLMAQLVPTQESLLAEATNLETNRVGDQRRFSVDVENARLRILELRALIASDQITLEDLALETKIAEELLKQGAIAPYQAQKAKVQYDTLAKKVKDNELLLEQAESDLSQAQQRRDEFAQRRLYHPSVDSALDVIRKAINVQEKRVEELLTRRVVLELKSPLDGVVSQIQRWQGEAVQANEMILTIAELEATEVIAYASEGQVNQIREGTAVELIKNSDPAQIARSQVISVGPALEQMPVQLWRNSNIPQWGRPFLVKAPPQMKLIIGERVGIRRL